MSSGESTVGFPHRVAGTNDDFTIGTRRHTGPSCHVSHLIVTGTEFDTVFPNLPRTLGTRVSEGIGSQQFPVGRSLGITLATSTHGRPGKGISALGVQTFQDQIHMPPRGIAVTDVPIQVQYLTKQGSSITLRIDCDRIGRPEHTPG